MSSPDAHSEGFLEKAPDACRYANMSLDPDDVGMKIASLIDLKSRVLDVGCGTGVNTWIIQSQRAASIIGLEPDQERARSAMARGIEAHSDVLSPEFVAQHGPFDYVVFADVIEHLPNPAEIVLMAKAGLKAGGSIVVSVPNIAHWFVRMDLLRGRFNYRECGIMDATHLRWFTRHTIRVFFERLGFSITAMDHTVNIDLPEYSERSPWRQMPPNFRRKFVGQLSAFWPELFGCQHIVRATLPK